MDRYREIIPNFDEFQEYLEKPLGRTARVNPVKSDIDTVIDELGKLDIGLERMNWYPDGFRIDEREIKIGNTLPYYLGWIHVQEEVSMIPPSLIETDKEGRVLDICAAPGSKATQIAPRTGTVIANDDSLGRISALRNNTDRLGLTNISVTSYDGRRMDGEDLFSHALVDVPCTSEGTARKYPENREQAEKKDIEGVQSVQKGILSNTINLVEPGGTVIYSTCTFAPEENEEVVNHVSDRVEIIEIELGLESSPGLTKWRGNTYPEEIERTRRIYPHQNDTGGFYVAKLRVNPGS